MTAPSIRVGVDLDGVVYDFTEAMRSYLAIYHGYDRAKLPDPPQWHTWESWGLTQAQFTDYFAQGVEAGHVWWTGEPEPGAVDALEDLRNEGHTIHIVTHRNNMGATGMANTSLWLEQHCVPYDSLTFSRFKTDLKTDIFLEDNVDNYLALEVSGVVPVLMDRPWNSRDPRALRFRSVRNFQQFYDLVGGYAAWREGNPLLENHRVKDYM